ncbi:carbohydrate phosphatase [Sarocladium strictum]
MSSRNSHKLEQQVAEAAVLQASILTKQVQSSVKEIAKDDRSPVTIADFAAQAILIGILHQVFPDDSFLGEETSAALRADESLCGKVYDLVTSVAESSRLSNSWPEVPRPADKEELLGWIDLGGFGEGGEQGRFWVIDPVDGTATFLRGQQYGVSLSLVVEGKEVVGVLGCPNIGAGTTRVSETDVDEKSFGVLLSAVRGQGSTLRAMTDQGLGEPISLTSIPSRRQASSLKIVGSTACPVTRHDTVAELAAHFNVKFPGIELWSSHIRYAALIIGDGSAQFWVPSGPMSRMHIWDHAGTQLIFTELGGKVTDLDGMAIDFGAGRDLTRNRGLVAAWEEFHPSLLRVMNEIEASH